MRQPIYLDYNATQPVRPVARDAMMAALGEPANASSIYRFGEAARRIVELARADVAALIAARPTDIIFTAGATEANATALNGFKFDRILASAVEHPSILKGHPKVEANRGRCQRGHRSGALVPGAWSGRPDGSGVSDAGQ